MCDKESRRWFWFISFLSSLAVISIGGGTYMLYELHANVESHLDWAFEYHKDIPPDFHYQERYGLVQDLIQREVDHESREELDIRLQVLERTCSSREIEMKYIRDIIKETASSLKYLEQKKYIEHERIN